MRRRIWGWSLLLSLSGAQAAPITLSDALMTYQGSAAVRLSQEQLALARSRLSGARDWQWTIGATAGVSQVPPMTAAEADVGTTLSVVRPLGSAQEKTALALAQAYQRALFGVRRTELAEVRERVQAWHDLASAEQGVTQATEQLQAAQWHRQQAQARAAAGAATPLDTGSAELDERRAELGLSQANERLRQVRGQWQHLGLGDEAVSAGTWQPLPAPPALERWQRGDILDAELQLRQAEFDLQEARRDAAPSWEVQGSFGGGPLALKGGLDNKSGTQVAVSLNPLRDAPRSWSLGIGGQWRLGGQAAQAVRDNERIVALAQRTLQETRAAATREWQNRTAQRQAALRTLELAQQSRGFAERTLELTTQRREQGLISALDLQGARLGLHKAIAEVQDAQKNLDLATLALWESAGWLPALPTPTPQGEQ